MDVALDEFLLWESEDGDLEPFEGIEQLFVPWALFTWYLLEEDIEEIEVDIPLPPDTTPAEWYVQKNRNRVDSLERRVLDAVGRTPFSFFEVLEVSSGKTILFKDLLTGQTHNVSEHSATNYLEIGYAPNKPHPHRYSRVRTGAHLLLPALVLR